jgi:hypothetical protein
MSRKLTRAEAAQRVRDVHSQPCTPETLATKAWNGSGPPYCLAAGKAFYDADDVDRWAQARVSAQIRKAADARRAKHAEAAAC